MSESVEAFPLCWPHGRPRTKRPERSRFGVSLAVARDELIAEIQRLGGKQVVVSSNVELRRDGLPYASRREPDDPGVAVYFTYRGTQHCFACDQWDLVRDNIQAIRKTIEALRGIARWGTGDMMERAFTGFQALPDPESASLPSWRTVLGCENATTLNEVRAAYRRAAHRAHPDSGGDSDQFHLVQRAWEHAQAELA
ncbi:J domain-containing protein [Algiphilus sp.]|uniref:J domain-containing protein n=1 Tax=Algiphilus sp. TaxID=1872431 RepID=UPI003BA976D7